MLRCHFFASAALLLIVWGCSEQRPVIVENKHENAEIHSPAGNAIEAIKAYGFEQKDLVVNNLENVIADVDARIKDMRGRSRSIASNHRDDWNETLTKLEKTRDELELLNTRIKYATQDKWDEVKGTVLKRLEDVQSHLQKLQKIVAE